MTIIGKSKGHVQVELLTGIIFSAFELTKKEHGKNLKGKKTQQITFFWSAAIDSSQSFAEYLLMSGPGNISGLTEN